MLYSTEIDNMEILQAILLGIVQGLTEFLPVSSTGHLILAREILGMEIENGLAFDAILHLATAGAVVLYFQKDIWVLINTVLRRFSRLPVNRRDMVLVYALMAGTVPAIIAGLLLESTMETVFRNPLLVAGVLVAGSFLFMYAEWVYENSYPQNEMSVMKAIKIGLFQCLALVPGMSRSGAFLLAVPIMLGAGTKKFLGLIQSSDPVPWLSVGVGATAAFLTGLFAVHFMLRFVRSHSLWPFIWYRIILAGFVIFVITFG